MFAIIQITSDVCLLFAFKTTDQTGVWVYLMSRMEHLCRVSYLAGRWAKAIWETNACQFSLCLLLAARISHSSLALLILSEVRKYFMGREQKNHQANEKTTLSCTLAVLSRVCCFKCLCQTAFSLLCFRTASFSLKTGFPLPERAQKAHDLYFATGCRFFKAVWFLKCFLSKLIKATSPPVVKYAVILLLNQEICC